MRYKLFCALILVTYLVSFISCKKLDQPSEQPQDLVLAENTLIVSTELFKPSVLRVDSSTVTLNASGSGVDSVKVGSILVSDITSVAPDGFLRKVTGIRIVGNDKICQTEQATIEEAIVEGKVAFSKKFTSDDISLIDSSGKEPSIRRASVKSSQNNGLSFAFDYNEVVYDEDGDKSTVNDQVKLEGSVSFEPEFQFELDIQKRRLNKMSVQLNLKNQNKIKVIAEASVVNLKEEQVLKVFYLKPFTIIGPGGFPIPIAKQWIVLLIGADGNISAKITSGAENNNELQFGVKYENGSLQTIGTPSNTLKFDVGEFEAEGKVEPWLQIRYEVRPYGLSQSRIFLAAKGSIVGEGIFTPAALTISLNWGLRLSAKAQFTVFSRTLLDFEKTFFDERYPIGAPVVIPLNIGSGLVAYYPFNGNANDESGNGHNGLVRGASLGLDRKGSSNSAFSFSGDSTFIEIPHSSRLDITNDMTISAWILCSDLSLSQRIVDKATVSFADGYMLDIHPANQLRMIVANPPAGANQPQSLPVLTANNVWYHVAATYDGSKVSFYVNGQLINQYAISGVTTTNSNPIRIGANSSLSGNWFKGKIDDIRIYDRALSATEVQYLFDE